VFRQITRCNSAILSITFLHGEDMQPFDAHGKKCVGIIVQMDAVGHKRRVASRSPHLRRMDQSSAPTMRKPRAHRITGETNPSGTEFRINCGETNSANNSFMHDVLDWLGARDSNLDGGIKIQVFPIVCQCTFRKIAEIRRQSVQEVSGHFGMPGCTSRTLAMAAIEM